MQWSLRALAQGRLTAQLDKLLKQFEQQLPTPGFSLLNL